MKSFSLCFLPSQKLTLPGSWYFTCAAVMKEAWCCAVKRQQILYVPSASWTREEMRVKVRAEQ